MELEQIADESERGHYDFLLSENPNASHETRDAPPVVIDFLPTISAILSDLEARTAQGTISMRFHNTIIEALVKACSHIESRITCPPCDAARQGRRANHESRICLSGGCFQNAILTTKLKKRLVGEGFTVYTHSLVPPNDGGIALGQAAVAAHRYKKLI